MVFKEFSEYLHKIEQESSRTEITKTVAELLSKLGKGELQQAVYLLQGRVVPAYDTLELNFANRSFVNTIDALAKVHNISFDAAQEFGQLGDSGLLAEKFLQQLDSKPEAVSLMEVFSVVMQVAQSSGSGSVQKKSELIKALLMRIDSLSGRYLGRILTGNLRLGMSGKTMLDAISWAKTGGKSLRSALDRAYGVRADIGFLAEDVLLDSGDLSKVELELGVPLAAQLVEREKNAEAIIARHAEVIIQPKYDGLRAQLHYRREGFAHGGKIRIFSRNMEPLTEMFPDLEAVFAAQDLDSIILDGEVIGYDETTQSFLPFQETSQRRRKHDVAETSQSIPIKYFMFDLLYLNGKDLTLTPLAERLQKLHAIKFIDPLHKLEFTESPTFDDGAKLERYFRDQLDKGLEGIIAKAPNSVYSPGKRGFDWIKLKANTFSDLKDTVDAVIMGYYFGRGNRAKFGIGGFLVGIFNEKTNTYQTLAKVGSGVKEEEWSKFKAVLDEFKAVDVPSDYQIKKDLLPDVIVKPAIVSEIDADEISLSKNHTAGLTAAERSEDSLAYSLRFPRLKIFKRDKGADQTTTLAELARLYELGKSNS